MTTPTSSPLTAFAPVFCHIIGTCPPTATKSLFRQKDLIGRTSVALHQAEFYGVPLVRETAYAGYRDNLDMFIAATLQKERLLCDAPGSGYRLDVDGSFLPIPTTAVRFKSRITWDEATVLEFLQKTDKYGMEREKVGEGAKMQTFFIAKSPAPKMLQGLHASADPSRHESGQTLSYKSFEDYLLLQQVTAGFLQTQTYPASSTVDDEGEGDIASRVRVAFPSGVAAKRLAEDMRAVETRKRARTAEGEGEEEEESETEEEVYEFDPENMDYIPEAHDFVFTAKPSFMPLHYNIGSPSDVPNLPGLPFPYFDGMISPSAPFMRQHVASYFLRLLGGTPDAWKARFSQVRRSIDDIARTPGGMALAHIWKGMELSVRTQTRLFLVVERAQYAGFVLLGGGWAIHTPEGWKGPVEADLLRKSTSLMTSHAAAIHKVCALLSKCTLKDKSVAEVTAGMLKCSLDLVEAIQARTIPRGEKGEPGPREELGQFLGGITFAQPYLPRNAKCIADVLKLVASPEAPLPRTVSYFIPPSLENIGHRNLLCLSMFGPEAPSFLNMNGLSYQVAPPGIADPNEAQTKDGKKAMPMVIATFKGIQVAFQDLQKVLKDGVIRMNPNERAKENRCMVFIDSERDEVYGALRELMKGRGVQGIAPGGKKGKKRSAAEMEVDAITGGGTGLDAW